MDKVWLYVRKYIFTILLLIGAVISLIKGFTPDEETQMYQTNYFRYGGFGLLLMAIVSALYIGGLIKGAVNYVVMGVLAIICTGFAFFTYDSINDYIKITKRKGAVDEAVKQNLEDIRDVMVAYKNKYGKYTSNIDSLMHFLKNDKVAEIFKEGVVPDERITREEATILGIPEDSLIPERITEKQAVILGKIIRDTTWVPVEQKLFYTKKPGNKKRVYPYKRDSLFHVPYLEEDLHFEIITRVLDKGEGIKIPVFRVRDPKPFDPFNVQDTLMAGSLTEPSTNVYTRGKADWEDEK